MKPVQAASLLFIVMFLFAPAFPWQDDLDLSLRHPFELFFERDGASYLSAAQAEVRLGRYVIASKNHVWRGGVMGDVALIRTPSFLWHMGLAQETLLDDQNDISFRLLQAYYQAITGVKWRLPSGALGVGFRHRCSHGLDNAVPNRITIKSGLLFSYQWLFAIKPWEFNVEPGFNAYVIGQNSDLKNQPKGNLFLAAKGLWSILDYLQVIFATGFAVEMMGEGKNNVYSVVDSFENIRLQPLFNGLLGARLVQNAVKTDFVLHFAQNIDSGLGASTDTTSSLLLGINFLW